MKINLVGAFIRNRPFGTELAFAKGFQRLGGHEIRVIDPDYPGMNFMTDCDATVVFKWLEGPYLEEFKKLPGKKIVYQPDDLRFAHIKRMMVEMRKHCEFAFTFDDSGADLARLYGYKDAKKLLLTADNELYTPVYKTLEGNPIEIQFDVCFVGSMSYGANHKSRMRMLQLLQRDGRFKVGFASEFFNTRGISELYCSSRIVLNHATDVGQPFGEGFGYQCRHFEAGMTKSCLLSNVVTNDQSLRGFATFNSERNLIEQVEYLLANGDKRAELAETLYADIQANHLPEHRAQEMVDFIRGLS